MQGKQPRAAGRPRDPALGEGPAAAGYDVTASSRIAVLEEGLYALYFGEVSGEPGAGRHPVALPAILVSAPPANEYDPVELLTGWHEAGEWLGAAGGTVIVKAAPGGGVVMWTILGAGAAADCGVEIRPLERPLERSAAASPATSREPRESVSLPAPGDTIATEILLHIERQGDRRFAAEGWAGNRGRRIRVEAFSIRPLEALAPGQIEYKAFGPNGRETPWVSDDRLCGTRGRGLPLTGFAVRLSANLRQQFDVVYEGSFFDSGVAGPKRNGEPCMPARLDDPLEAINVRIVRRDVG